MLQVLLLLGAGPLTASCIRIIYPDRQHLSRRTSHVFLPAAVASQHAGKLGEVASAISSSAQERLAQQGPALPPAKQLEVPQPELVGQLCCPPELVLVEHFRVQRKQILEVRVVVCGSCACFVTQCCYVMVAVCGLPTVAGDVHRVNWSDPYCVHGRHVCSTQLQAYMHVACWRCSCRACNATSCCCC